MEDIVEHEVEGDHIINVGMRLCDFMTLTGILCAFDQVLSGNETIKGIRTLHPHVGAFVKLFLDLGHEKSEIFTKYFPIDGNKPEGEYHDEVEVTTKQ